MDVLESGSADEAEVSPEAFQHMPLDHTKASIRLLRILPELSSKGHVQCHIWHDNVEARYTCLSYVWGSNNDQQTISLNAKAFRVRKNLFDFLVVARTKYAESQRTFWIDAISIDQTSILERNHQVAQMGSIYAKAEEAIGWLGSSQGIERALTFCIEISTLKIQSAANAWELWLSRRNRVMNDWRELQAHEYWERAWITQEILSARRYKVLVNHLETDPTQFSVVGLLLPGINKTPIPGTLTMNWTTKTRLFNSYLEALCGQNKVMDRKLVQLLHQFPGRQSQIPRDRLYSLLPIASDVDSFPIDYGSEDDTVLLTALKHLKRSMCLCLWSHIANALEYPTDAGSGNSNTPEMPIMHLMLSPCLQEDVSNSSASIRDDRTCSHCGRRPIARGLPSKQVFCTRQICKMVKATHFCLIQASTLESFEWIKSPGIAVHSVTETCSFVGNRSVCDQKPPQTHHDIQLTAQALVQLTRSTVLFEKFGENRDIYQVPLELCHKARVGHRSISFHTILRPDLQNGTAADAYVIVPVPALASLGRVTPSSSLLMGT